MAGPAPTSARIEEERTIASAAYQADSPATARRNPPTGERVDIGDRRLHLRRAGQGSPVVVIVADLGALGSE